MLPFLRLLVFTALASFIFQPYITLGKIVLHSKVTQNCAETSLSSFNLNARYKNDTSNAIAVKVINVYAVPMLSFSIPSTCSSCITSWQYNMLQNGSIHPKSTLNPNLNTVSYTLSRGESPVFVSSQFLPPPLAEFCFTNNAVNSKGSMLLAAYQQADEWFLCPNSTANGRLDVVWAAISGHPHYTLANCIGINLEQV